MAGSLGWLLAYLDFNQIVLNALRSVSDNGTVVILTLLGILILLTMFVESLAVLIVFVPFASYVGGSYGFDPLHVGILMVVATQIGATTPSVVVLLFVTTSAAEADFLETVHHCVPFILKLVLFLLLLVFVPSLTSWLPSAFM